MSLYIVRLHMLDLLLLQFLITQLDLLFYLAHTSQQVWYQEDKSNNWNYL